MQSVMGKSTINTKNSARMNMIEQSPSAMILNDLLQHSGRLLYKEDGQNRNPNDETLEVLKEMQKS